MALPCFEGWRIEKHALEGETPLNQRGFRKEKIPRSQSSRLVVAALLLLLGPPRWAVRWRAGVDNGLTTMIQARDDSEVRDYLITSRNIFGTFELVRFTY